MNKTNEFSYYSIIKAKLSNFNKIIIRKSLNNSFRVSLQLLIPSSQPTLFLINETKELKKNLTFRYDSFQYSVKNVNSHAYENFVKVDGVNHLN